MEKGVLQMIDISEKKVVKRTAIARGEIKLKKRTIKLIKEKRIKKGDVFITSKIAGINAVKNTSSLIPLCHPIPLTSIHIDFEIKEDTITCYSEVKANYKTGVEMEALTGVIIALLTVWDMVKYLEKDEKGQYPETKIENVVIMKKSKGD